MLTTFPFPSAVITDWPIAGKSSFTSRYWAFSNPMQHFSLPHTPEIFEGATDTPCSLAIFIETESNLFIIDLQHNVFPQFPQSPTILA